MERSPLLSPLQTASNQLKSSRIHSTVSSPGGVQQLRSSSRSPPPSFKQRSESHDRSFANTRKYYERSRSQERDERTRPRDFSNTDRRRPPRNGPIAYPNRNGQDGSPPSDMGFQESPRLKISERFQPRERFRPPEILKNNPAMIDHPGQLPSTARYFGPSSAPSGSSISHPRDFSPPTNYKNSMNEPNGSRSVDYYSGISPNVGPGVGLGLGPARYGDREDWRGRINQFSREFERDRDFRNRDIRQDIRDMRDSRPPRDPRDIRDMRDTPFRERDMRDRDMAYQRGPDHRDRDPRDRDLRELGITTRELRDKDNRDRDLRERGSWSSDAKGRDNFPGREAPDLDVRELVERERERERERDWERGDRNRERPIRLRDQDKDLDGNIPTRPALDHINRERERERERLSNSRSMTRVQDLDRDLLAYTSDKPRQTFGKEDDGADRDMVKSINFLNSSSLNTQRELKQQDGDDIRDRERARDRDRLHQREDVKDSFGREREFHNRHDGAGLRSDADSRQRNAIVGRRPRILSAPGLNDFSHGEILGTQLRNFHDRISNPTSPVAVGESPSGRIERIEKQDDRGLIGKLELPLVPSTTDVLSSTNQDQQSFENTKQATGQRNNTVVQDTMHLVPESGHANESPAKESIADSTAAISDNTSDGSMKQDLSKNSLLTKLFQGANDSTTLVVQLNTNNTQERSDADIPSDANGRLSVLQEVSDANSIPSNRIDNPVQSKNVSDSASSNGVYVAKDSSAVKAAQGPSMTSLPSPRVSPIHEAIVVELPKDTDEFESHNDILKRIDTIDVQIQHVEDLILKRRQQKLHHEEEIQLTDHPGSAQDEDMNIDIEQPDSESVAEETAMDVDEKFTPLPEETVHDDLRNGDLLMNGGVAPSPVELVPDKDTEDTRLETIDSEDTDMMASDAEIRKDRRRQIIQQFSRQELHNPIDEDDPFFKRKEQQKRRPQLYDQIYAENNTRAKKYGRVHSALGSSREHVHSHQQNEQSKPQIYESVEDYPFYQENIENHLRLRNALLHNMATKAAELDEKELELKREYKHHWEAWIKKVEKLDKIKEKMSNAPLPANVREEDLVQSDNVLFTTRNRRGAYNSDAVRSEAELMEIIQSLENADMRNPDLRASRTAATVPPMILDPNIREKVHYYDRNHLVTDPAKYYRLGPVTDIWTEEEREIFIKRYLNYPKQFGKIAAGIENKTASQCVLFYYREKKKIGFKDMVSNRGRKRKPAAGKRKEKVVQQSSPSGQPGKKHKGSALIEDIGQANRKMAKSKEVRGLHDLHQNWADFDGEPITRRRVRSTVLGQQNSTPILDEGNSNVASPVPSAASTPVNAAGERRKQRSKATNTRSSTAAASNKTVTEDVVTEEKKSKTENVTPASAITATTNAKSTSKGDTIVSVESSKVSAASSKQSHAMVLETIEESATTTTVVTPPSGGVTRWTAAEQEKFKAALKKHGRNFEAVAIAVGTKTVDQCKNFRFNYRRKYGVSALDDANNHDTTVFDDEKEDKEMSSAGADRSKTKKGKATSSTITSTPNTPQSAAANVNKDTVATPSGRRKSGKPPAQETVKEDSTKELSIQSNDNEELEAIADKRRRKRAVSKSEAGGNSAESIQSATSFRARYSRDLSEASSPSISATSQMEDQFSGQSNVDGSVRRSNFSSYWSRQEKIDFTRLISLHGKDWEKISKAMKTKTLIQVRNYYSHNAEKLAAEGIVGGDILGSLPPTYKEDEGTLLENRSDQQINEGDHADQDIADNEDHGSTECPSTEADSKSSHFNPPNLGDDKDDSKLEETPQSVTPPRRITNIGNLLNNDDEDVNVAVEDWFGNDEDGSNAQSPQQPFEVVQGSTQNQRQRYSNEPSHFGEEDIDTEDEYEQSHSTREIYESSATSTLASNHRHPSEVNASIRNSYSSISPIPSYYNHAQNHHPHSSLHPSRTASGVLGSPYDSQQYYQNSTHARSGYRSPPPPLSPSPGPHGMQRMKSPSISLTSGPSSTVMQPTHYPSAHVSHHHQHQRSSSIGQLDMVSRPNASPQPSARDHSPMPLQGSYFSQSQGHGYVQSSSHVPYGYAQHHGSQHTGPIEVIPTHSRRLHEPPMTMQHPSSSASSVGHSHSHSHSHGHVHSHGHGHSHGHSHNRSQSHGHGHSYGHSQSGSVSRYSGSPQLPGSGSIRGSPVPVGPSTGPGSPAHLSHGGNMPSRYSPIPTSSISSGPSMSGLVGPVTSPRQSEPPVHHSQQHHYQQHLRRSSSPFQHHISGQIPAPSYLQPPPTVMHSSSTSKHQSSSSFGYGPPTPTSILPPPPSSSVAVSSAIYHPGHQQPSYSHPHHSTLTFGTPPPHSNQQQSSHHHHLQ